VDRVIAILEILRERSRASRAELAERSGLSPATVSRAVAYLKQEGLVLESSTERDGPGRPPRMVELRPGAAQVLGIDAGGTRIRAVVTDLDGSVRGRATGLVRSPRDGDEVVRTIAEVAAHARAEAGAGPVLASAAGISGIVDRAEGRVLLSPDLPGLHRMPVVDRLELAIGTPVGIDNDDLLAAVGEAALGSARGCANVAFLSLGYGLGAGLIVGGRPVRGAHAAAGAIAYLAPGTLEDRASGRVIPARYATLAGDRAGRVDAERVFRLAAQGDRVAASVVRDVIDALGELVVNVAALLDPEVIVIGGGLAASEGVVLAPLQERLRTSVPYPPSLVPSELGGDAVARGAAVMALALAKDRIARSGRRPALAAEPARIGVLELV
jgi:predicted NBD/HSP70 family sugar kinase